MSIKQEISTPDPFVLIVSGSPRLGGNSDTLAKHIAQEVTSASLDAEIVNLSEHEFSGCIGCERCRKSGICTQFDDGMTPIYDKLLRAQGLVLISPVHNYNVTSWTKAFIDRLYCFYEFENPRPGPWRSVLSNQGRTALVVAVSEQNDVADAGFALEAMRMPLEALGYEVIEDLLVPGVFGKGEVARRPEALRTVEDAARDLAERVSS